MTPTAFFRWLVRENKVTAADVRLAAMTSGESMATCKERLTARQTPVLQQFWKADNEPLQSPDVFDGCVGRWRDVLTHIEYREL